MAIEDELENLRFNYTLLEARITALEEYNTAAEKKARKKRINEVVTINDVKNQFLEENPREKTNLTDNELGLWAVFVMPKGRKELISSWAEFYKRGKLAKKVVDYFLEKGHEEERARDLAKEYFEMIFTLYPTFKSKDGEQIMTYFTATSDFAIGHYGPQVANWKQVKNLPDESLD